MQDDLKRNIVYLLVNYLKNLGLWIIVATYVIGYPLSHQDLALQSVCLLLRQSSYEYETIFKTVVSVFYYITLFDTSQRQRNASN